ncbi:hypothetical protein [Rhodanobacter lindaniclasticus]
MLLAPISAACAWFVHRRYWVQTLCHACGGIGMCGRCEKGLIVQPTEDPAILATLPAYLVELEQKRSVRHVPRSSAVA